MFATNLTLRGDASDRANASRRELTLGGLPTDHMLRVQGLADSRPFDQQDPRAPANRRISIVVMNREAEDRVYGRTPWGEQEEAAQDVPSIRPDLAPLAGAAQRPAPSSQDTNGR